MHPISISFAPLFDPTLKYTHIMKHISLPQWQTGSVKLILLVSLYFLLIFNFPFLRTVFQLYQPTGGAQDYFVYTVPIVLFALLNLIFNILTLPWLHKIIIPLLIIIAAAISYNSLFFNVYFNRDMLDNVLQTNAAEASRLISPSYLAWLVFLGVLPALVYLRTKIVYQVWWKELGKRLISIVCSLAVVASVAAFSYQDYASFFRNNLTLKHLIVPSNFMAASISKIKRLRAAQMPYQALGKDAKMLKTDNRRNVSVLVLGETTRAQNWGLNGYTKQTTPKLAERLKQGEALINFPNVQSCGTFTALSVPCMFSSLTREDYNELQADHQDNLLDTLQHAGVNVQWVENNSDCKGVCKNVPSVDVIHLNLPEFCTDGECLDNIMLPELDKMLAATEKDTLVVLHTIGSHGPTYFERYTPEERLFSPTCDTKEINRCSNEQLANTYDNSIVYLDQLLDKVIARLAAHPDWKSSMLYVSDHGESLGENGIYLHSTPYAIAPKEQTSVPMVIWLSPAWVQHKNTDLSCLQRNAGQAYSHDHLFHTVFSLMDIDLGSLKQYNPNLDILAACRKK